jgi:hypothetical protein
MYDTETVFTVTEEDIYTTNAIAEPGLKVFLDRRMSSGDEQLDKIVEAEMSKVIGFPLRRLTSTRQTTKKLITDTRSEMNVIEVKKINAADSLFEVPKDFTELDPNESGIERAMRKLENQQKEKKP